MGRARSAVKEKDSQRRIVADPLRPDLEGAKGRLDGQHADSPGEHVLSPRVIDVLADRLHRDEPESVSVVTTATLVASAVGRHSKRSRKQTTAQPLVPLSPMPHHVANAPTSNTTPATAETDARASAQRYR